VRPIFLTAAIIGLLALSSEVNAKIGETVDQCIARYGEPINKITGQLGWFRKTVYFIECHFVDGKCDVILFRRVGGKEIRSAAAARKELESMAMDEVRAIVESMDSGKAGQWKVSSFDENPVGSRTEWRAGFARAVYDDRDGAGALIIFSHEHGERLIRDMEESGNKEREFLR